LPMNHCLTRPVKEVVGAALAVAAGGGEAGDGCGGGAAAAAPAVAAGGCGGGDSEPVNPVNDEQPAKAVSAIIPTMVLRKLRHSVPGRASKSPMEQVTRGTPRPPNMPIIIAA
jgi:hypothetical protein